MENERVVFAEERVPGQYLKLVASGDWDDGLLGALEDLVKRRRQLLRKAAPADVCANCENHTNFARILETNNRDEEKFEVHICNNCGTEVSRLKLT